MTDSSPAPAALDGLSHLQNAAREMIAAARAFLDAAEHVVDDPQAVTQAVTMVGSLVQAASGFIPKSGPEPARGDDPVERIVVT